MPRIVLLPMNEKPRGTYSGGLIAAVSDVDISGEWTASVETPMGRVHFVVKDAVLTGTIESTMGNSPVTDGKVDGDKVTFTEVLKCEGVELRIVYSGQITSTDEIQFTRHVGDFATERFAAKRSK